MIFFHKSKPRPIFYNQADLETYKRRQRIKEAERQDMIFIAVVMIAMALSIITLLRFLIGG